MTGDSPPRGTEAPVCRPDNLSGEVCCLPGARICDITRRLPSWVKPQDYHPFLLFYVGTNEVARRKLGNIQRDLMSPGRMLKGPEHKQCSPQSSQLEPGVLARRRQRTNPVNDWLRGWCHAQGVGFYLVLGSCLVASLPSARACL